MKRILTFFFLFVGLFILAACASPTNVNEDINLDDLREFTLEELSQYDGREGRDAYIAVDGFVYDVTNSSRWQNGNHQGRVQAGQDLTDVLNTEATHGREVLDRVPIIGIIVEAHAANEDTSNDDLEDSPTDETMQEDTDDTVVEEETNNEEETLEEETDTEEELTEEEVDDEEEEEELRVFTIDELANYDGKEGRDAYIAVDGFVYDVTNSSRWNEGNHQGRVQAGQDLTEVFNTEAPHGREVLNRVPLIGILVNED